MGVLDYRSISPKALGADPRIRGAAPLLGVPMIVENAHYATVIAGRLVTAPSVFRVTAFCV